MKTQAIIFDYIAPHPEPVQIAALLADIEATIKKHVILSDHAAAALAVWVLHTWTFELRDVVAYVAIESPEKRCGKTTLLSVLAAMAHKSLIASNVTVGALFRAIDTCRPTLFIDEADTFLAGNGTMRGIINSGNTWRTAFVLRLTKSKKVEQASHLSHKEIASLAPTGGAGRGENSPKGDSRIEPLNQSDRSVFQTSDGYSPSPGGEGRGEGELPPAEERGSNIPSVHGQRAAAVNQINNIPPGLSETADTGLKKYSCWCPKVIAMIGQVPDTIADRSIVVPMSRKLVTESCAPLAELNTAEIKAKCARFALDARDSIAQSPKIRGEGLNDRAADTFDPLYVIAHLAGHGWPEKLHAAARSLNSVAQSNNSGAELLMDILSIFFQKGRERILIRDIARGLREGSTKSFALKYSTINEQLISQILRSYGIKTITVRAGQEVGRGYAANQLHEAIGRYVPRDVFQTRIEEFRHRDQLQAEARAEAQQEQALMQQVLAEAPKDHLMTVPEAMALITQIKQRNLEKAKVNGNVTNCNNA